MRTIRDIDLFEVANRHFTADNSGNIILQAVIKEMVEETPPHPATVYVYKSFCDEYAYSEEVVEVYASKEAAMKRLKEDVESAYGLKWEEIPEEIGLDEDDGFTPEYVSIYDGDGATSFWVVEERTVL